MMKNVGRNVLSLAVIVALIIFGGSCSMKQSYPAKDYFALEIARATEVAPPSNGEALLVQDFIVSPKFEHKGFVYRIADLSYETDYYNEFLVPPGPLLSEDTREWLAGSGLFALVGDRKTVVSPTYSLDARVTALYGDMREKGREKAVLEVKFFVFESVAPDFLLRHQKTYREEVPLDKRSPTALVEGWNTAFRNILTVLEKDLREI